MISTPLTRLARTALGAALLAATTSAFAVAPLVKTPGPGYYRMMLGEFEITVVSDGTVDLPIDQLLKEKPAKIQGALKASFLKAPLETSVNTFLINTGSKLVLVDAGAGQLFGPTLGKLVDNLKAAGYQPEQVDEIYITHLHPDHVGGLGSGTAVFPNATLRFDQHDADYWLSADNANAAPEDKKPYFAGAQAAVAGYKGKVSTFSGDTDLVPGIKASSGYGHTPGHTTYVIESQGQKLVLVGDLIHAAFLQFDDPTVTIAFDSDAKAAYKARKAAFDAAASGGYLIGAAHLPFPSLGHLRGNGKGYRFYPVNYTVPR
jgi:glyoxylase-like metal-dependent hydrolase (beta-lactamase superfamily II)